MTHLPGWSVTPQMLVRRERWPGGYKTKGIPLVYPGQDILADQPVIRLERKEPGAAFVSVSQHSLPGFVDGPTSAGYAAKNGNARIQDYRIGETLPAGLRGRVVDVTRRGGVIIESCATVLPGVIGAGNQVVGVLTMWQATEAAQGLLAIPAGALLVVPGPLTFALLRQAMISGVVGVIASSISARDLEGFLRTDLVKLIDSVDVDMAQVHLPQMTVILTEGLGELTMPARTLNLLNRYQGSIALLSGATSVRQGIFPELVISLSAKEVQPDQRSAQFEPTLKVGVHVRVCSGEYEGASGVIDHIFVHEQVFVSGMRARAVHLRLEDSSLLTVPLAQVERIL